MCTLVVKRFIASCMFNCSCGRRPPCGSQSLSCHFTCVRKQRIVRCVFYVFAKSEVGAMSNVSFAARLR